MLFAGAPVPEWEDAAVYASEHRGRWCEVFQSLEADCAECEAIVFPELLRYNRLKDGVETAVLLAPYVRKGAESANFSVGIFQMKPSFAEQVEKAWMRSGMRHEYGLYFNTEDSREVRRKRVERLADEQWQCVYLAVFVRLMLEREPSLAEMSASGRVRLLATAYNYSFTAPVDELRKRSRKKTFHLDFVKTKNTVCYNYAGLAEEHYKELNDY